MNNIIKKIKLDKIFISNSKTPEEKITKIIVYTCVVFLFLLFFISLITFSVIFEKKENVKVPNVIGMTLVDAMQTMQNNFLNVKVNKINSNKIEDKNTVINQSKKEGSIVKEGYTIHLGVSQGPVVEKMIDFVGWNIDEASAYLKNIDSLLTLKKPYALVLSQKEPGTILAQSPVAGTEIYESTDVGFFISSGPYLTVVESQNYVGKDFVSVVKSLANQNINFNFTSKLVSGKEIASTIVSQEPAAGTSLGKSTGYKFVVAEPKWKGVRKVFGIANFKLDNYKVPVLISVEKRLVQGGKENLFTTNSFGGEISFPYFDDAGTVYSLYVAGKLFKEIKVVLND